MCFRVMLKCNYVYRGVYTYHSLMIMVYFVRFNEKGTL